MFGYNNRVVLSYVSFISPEKDKPYFLSSFLSVSLHLLPSAVMFLPPSFLLLSILPFFGPAPEEPRGSCWIGLALENKRQLLCECVCCELAWVLVCVPCTVFSPHMLALTCCWGEDYQIQALIKSGFVYPPAWKQKQFVRSLRHTQDTRVSHKKHKEDFWNTVFLNIKILMICFANLNFESKNLQPVAPWIFHNDI